MFWKRKQHPSPSLLSGGHMSIMLDAPAKKAFETMLEILKDAEKYDNQNEIILSDSLLTNLCEYIETYKAKKSINKENTIKDILVKTERKNKERL